jgi:HK97 family phage portal protein
MPRDDLARLAASARSARMRMVQRDVVDRRVALESAAHSEHAQRTQVQNRSINTSSDLARHLGGESYDPNEVIVTPETAMRMSTVFSCVRVLSEDVASLPLIVYRRLPDGRERADDHWLSRLLDMPNQWQTGLEFRAMQQAHIELCGNFFALKTVLPSGEVAELLPISPYRVTVELLPNWTLKYEMTWPDGRSSEVPAKLMYHQTGLSLNGYLGLSPIAYQRETIALGMNLVRYGTKLFKNGAMIGGYLAHPTELSEPAATRLKESFEEKYSGIDNAHKVVLLEEGTTFTATGMKADDAQFLESRKYSRSEIAGFYRVPLHLINDLERATFSNIEHQSQNYVQFGLLPRMRRIEARMRLSIMPKDDRSTLYVEHLVDGLLRGDYATRQRGYQTAILTGYMTRNEARIRDNMNKGPAELDKFLVPVNMAEADKLNQQQDTEDNKDKQNTDNTSARGAIRAIK